MWKRYLVEIGYGADLHGMDGMEAAARAVRDAVSHCCMCGLVETLGVKDLRSEIRVPEPLKKLLITDNVDVEVVQGGMMLNGIHRDEFGEGDQIMIVIAGLTVYVKA